MSAEEDPLWRLLMDEIFQSDLADWLMAGGIAEGNEAKDRLVETMTRAIERSGGLPERTQFLKTGFFEIVDRAVFSNPILANWRHQLSLDYLREQVAELRRRAEEAVGVYSAEKRKAAMDRYCEMALDAWDIIDLSSLPESDIDIATQKLFLRQLYMPLRLTVEVESVGERGDAAFVRLEEERAARRLWEAGRDVMPDGPTRRTRPNDRTPVGTRLGVSQRLVVLADPGGGKTTMLRWMATAYLLNYRRDPTRQQIPDISTLPDKPWIPVLIRCRDLGEADLCRSFTDFLTQHFLKSELLPAERPVGRS